jgi:DNA replication protein DnaC
MSGKSEDSNISQFTDLCRQLKLPAVAIHLQRVVEESNRQKRGLLSALTELLELEVEARFVKRVKRRQKEAAFPLLKSLQSFDFTKNPNIDHGAILRLSDGDYIKEAQPILFLGEPGTGKTHLATALGICAAQQGRRVHFVTAASLVTNLIEARDALTLSRQVAKYSKYELLIIDELGYLPLSTSDAELLFRVIGERHEKRTTIVTTNLPFSEWTSMFTDTRLCRAIVDRLTHKAHIIETGVESMRLQETLENLKRKKKRRK